MTSEWLRRGIFFEEIRPGAGFNTRDFMEEE